MTDIVLHEHYNQESNRVGDGGSCRRTRGPSRLFLLQEPPQVHPAAVVCHADPAPVLPHGLSGACRLDRQVARTPADPRHPDDPSLLDPLLRGEKASKKNAARALFDATIALARCRRLIGTESTKAAIDSTGLETRHVSVYYTRRCNRQKGHLKHRWPKLSAICDTKSHLVLAAVVDRGPRLDYAEFRPALYQALSRHRFDTLLADAGYEGEGIHELCRHELGIRSIIPTTHRGRRRGDGRPNTVTGHYRRKLHRSFPKKTYGQRWQIETVFSMIKRRLGSALHNRKPFSINREVVLRVLTHNLMIIRRLLACFQQSRTVPS